MKIAVFGLGYVGVVTAACLAKEGHRIFGIDVSTEKIDLINSGISPIIEDEIGELIDDAVRKGLLTASSNSEVVVPCVDMVIVCVGTPSNSDGSLDTKYVEGVCRELGSILANSDQRPLIVIRSTVVPGTMRGLVLPVLKSESQNRVTESNVVFHPEFLREGSSVRDFYDPPKIVVGEAVSGAGDLLVSLYEEIAAPLFRVSFETAEMVKYADNLFHAVKVTFANEMGQFCKEIGVSGQDVMRIFCSDTKLNISEKYLRPGFAFGGSCLPKDMRAFLSVARQAALDLPMIGSVLPSNKLLIERASSEILGMKVRQVGMIGLAFKWGTDDLRESPLVTLAEILLGKGIELRIFDSHVKISQLVGRNKAFIEQHLPHLSRLLVDNVEDLMDSQLLIIGHSVSNPEISRLVENHGNVVHLNE